MHINFIVYVSKVVFFYLERKIKARLEYVIVYRFMRTLARVVVVNFRCHRKVHRIAQRAICS